MPTLPGPRPSPRRAPDVRKPRCRWLALLCAAGVWVSAAAPALAATCEARSGATAPTVVELYTSEGCSSCPPADRWLSSLSRRSDVLALAFHVSYWDRLGWVDRFASPVYTERQRALMAPSGARYVYTPQVLVNGRDWRAWPTLPPETAAAPLDLQLSREGTALAATIRPRSEGSPLPSGARLSGYWAVLEDGHRSQVRAGENAGETLKHDHVVRQYQAVASWAADREQRWRWQATAPMAPAADGVRRRVVFVVVDAATQRPLQALALAC